MSQFVLLAGSAFAQHVFSIEVDTLTRSYLVIESSRNVSEQLPLIVLLHDNDVAPFSLARLNWSTLQRPAIVAMPVAWRGQWSCSREDLPSNDETFLMNVIFKVQRDFNVDTKRVFMVGMGNASCVASQFTKRHPELVRTAVNWNRASAVPITSPGQAQGLDSLLAQNTADVTAAAGDTLLPIDDDMTSSAGFSYVGHSTLAFHLGRWQQSRRSRGSPDTVTLTDLADYHLMFGFELGYHLTAQWSFVLGTDVLIIPKEQRINGISWGGGQGIQVSASGKGGIVIPYGVGVRYAFPRKAVVPFFSTMAGSTFMFIGGGSATGSPGNISRNIVKRKVSLFRYSVDAGCDVRLKPGTSLQLKAGYTFSSKISPELASVDRFEGLHISGGLVFTIRRR